jgi:hypothetical protein
MQSAGGGVWFPTPAVPSPFPAELAVSTDCRPLLSYPSKFILPYALLPFRVLPSRTRPAPPGVEPLPWGWPSLFATSACGVHVTGVQSRHLAVLDVSHVPDGLLRHWPCGFVSPHSHVQGSPFRGFPSRTAVAPRRRPACPRVGWRRFAADSCPPAPRSAAPPSGLYSVRESVAESTVFSRRPDPIPSWAFLPPGPPSRRRANAFTPAAAHDLHRGSVESFPQLIFSVPSSSLADLSRGCRPARSS